jgi:hypothetical protein
MRVDSVTTSEMLVGFVETLRVSGGRTPSEVPMDMTVANAPELPLRTLRYRYFFYGWLFKDVFSGTSWERSAAWRHNRAQARWLPTYMRRWSLVMVVLFVAALGVEVALMAPQLSAVLYVPSILAVPFNAVTALCWVFLNRA